LNAKDDIQYAINADTVNNARIIAAVHDIPTFYPKIGLSSTGDKEYCAKKLGLKSITRRKYRVQTTDSNHTQPIADNVLCRDFKAEKPNEKWVTDITYVATLEVGCILLRSLICFHAK
jgi:transposase InsO family protein